jgi:hypothetical protein
VRLAYACACKLLVHGCQPLVGLVCKLFCLPADCLLPAEGIKMLQDDGLTDVDPLGDLNTELGWRTLHHI